MLQKLRRLMPAPMYSAVRSVLCTVAGPMAFSVTTGHAKSAMNGKALDRDGRPIPWLTYPAIDFLRAKDLRRRRVLEFGSGQSTLWWAIHAKEVFSFEDGPEWHAYVTQRAPSNVKVHLVRDSVAEMKSVLEGQPPFDIVLIDSFDRAAVAAIARDVVTSDGVVILDNAEGFWGPEGTYPIMDLFREASFQRVDFFGFAPAMFKPHCTSIFFRDGCFLFRGSENPPRYAGLGKQARLDLETARGE
jgi:hypothetical protein